MNGWMWLTLGTDRFLAYGYVDAQAGPSAKGVKVSDPPTGEELAAVARPSATFRMPMGQVAALTAEEITRFGLPAEPEWMEFFRPAKTPWSEDPRLQGQLHPSYPNDLQAVFFLPVLRQAEAMWVRLSAPDPVVEGYRATLLNDSHFEPALKAGTPVTVRPTPGLQQPIWLSEAMRANLGKYRGACEQCGFDLVMTPVEELIRATFSNVPEGMLLEQFTTRCGLCGSTQMLEAVRN